MAAKRHLNDVAAARYTKVLTSLALLQATYSKFLSRLEESEKSEWPQFAEWLRERAAAHESRSAGE
jgi:hypothetical protein